MVARFQVDDIVGPDYDVSPRNATNTKKALSYLGFRKTPPHGDSSAPTREMVDAVKAFQKSKELKVDGVIKPGGPTEKALNTAIQKKVGKDRRKLTDPNPLASDSRTPSSASDFLINQYFGENAASKLRSQITGNSPEWDEKNTIQIATSDDAAWASHFPEEDQPAEESAPRHNPVNARRASRQKRKIAHLNKQRKAQEETVTFRMASEYTQDELLQQRDKTLAASASYEDFASALHRATKQNEGKPLTTKQKTAVLKYVLGKNKDWPKEQIEYFAQNYEIIDAHNGKQGFRAALFRDKRTGKEIYSIAGTHPSELISDVVMSDIGGIALKGHTRTSKYAQAYLDHLKHKGLITGQIEVTGHSLGGHITENIVLNNPDLVTHAYTFNAPGQGGLSQQWKEAKIVAAPGGMHGMPNPNRAPEYIFNDKITHIQSGGSSTINGLGTSYAGNVITIDNTSGHFLSDILKGYNKLLGISYSTNRKSTPKFARNPSYPPQKKPANYPWPFPRQTPKLAPPKRF